MGESDGASQLQAGLNRALARAGLGNASRLKRLTGGATMESWRFEAGGEAFVLRRAPSPSFIEERPFGHDTEAAVITAAAAKGVTAPDVIVQLEETDGIGSGFVMRALPGTPDPRAILAMDESDGLLSKCAAQLARIHMLSPEDVPSDVPVMVYREAIAGLKEQFIEAGGDRPILALGLKWLEDHCPEPVQPVLNHGDFRLGNLLAEDGRLTGVLDWELAHFGDWHEDLAFGCMPVWRFGAYERPALGLGTLETYFAAYEAHGGRPVDRDRFRFWTIYRTVWWALGCLRNARMWREDQDRMLERVVISRRTSEQELDLLLVLEEAEPLVAKTCAVRDADDRYAASGEADLAEIATAVSEWLATIKDRMEGHDRFQLAVARNALGIVARSWQSGISATDRLLAEDILAGRQACDDPDLIRSLRASALAKLETDMPKYPSLAIARDLWLGDE